MPSIAATGRIALGIIPISVNGFFDYRRKQQESEAVMIGNKL